MQRKRIPIIRWGEPKSSRGERRFSTGRNSKKVTIERCKGLLISELLELMYDQSRLTFNEEMQAAITHKENNDNNLHHSSSRLQHWW